MPRKIEEGCYAVVRATGEAVRVGKRHAGYRAIPATFETEEGEYQASELNRVSADEFARLEDATELRLFRQLGW